MVFMVFHNMKLKRGEVVSKLMLNEEKVFKIHNEVSNRDTAILASGDIVRVQNGSFLWSGLSMEDWNLALASGGDMEYGRWDDGIWETVLDEQNVRMVRDPDGPLCVALLESGKVVLVRGVVVESLLGIADWCRACSTYGVEVECGEYVRGEWEPMEKGYERVLSCSVNVVSYYHAPKSAYGGSHA